MSDRKSNLLPLGCSLLMLALGTGCRSWPPTFAASDGISVKVTLETRYQLTVELQNSSKNEITASKDSLPWEWRYSMWVKAYHTDAGGSTLDERLPISDPTRIEIVRLAPGASMKGRIDLLDRFPELQTALEKRDVVLFWSYQPEFESVHASRLSGWLTIPKQ